MKRIFLIFTLLVTLLLSGIVSAADTYDKNVTLLSESKFHKLVRVDQFLFSDSTGNYYSEPINLAGLNVSDGYIQVLHTNVTGTEDIDVTLQYSFTKSNFGTWTTGTADANLTQLTGGTAVYDTLGIADGADQILFHSSVWLRVKYDGQSGNPSATQVTTYLWFTKPQ